MKQTFLLVALLFLLMPFSASAAEKSDSVGVSGNVLDSFTRQYLDSISVRLYTIDHATLLLDTLCTDALYTIKDSTQREMAAKYWPKVYRLRYAFRIPAGNYVLELACRVTPPWNKPSTYPRSATEGARRLGKSRT